MCGDWQRVVTPAVMFGSGKGRGTGVAAVLREDVFKIGGWDERFRGWGYDDSVSQDTPITIRVNGIPDIVEIGDLMAHVPDSDEPIRIPVDNTEVWTRGGWKKLNYAYRHKVSKPLYQINTTNSSIKVTGDHSLFTNEAEVKVSGLSVGGYIDQVNFPDTLQLSLPLDLAWLMGLFAAEGSAKTYILNSEKQWKQNNWKIDNKNKSLLEKAMIIAKKYFSNEGHDFVIREFKDGMFRLDIVSQDREALVKWFAHRFYTATGKKRVPQEVLNASLASKKEFLLGHFAGDGSFDKKLLTRGYTTNSFALARGIEQLLFESGINVTVSTRDDKPDVFLLRERKGQRRKTCITKIKCDEDFSGYVYDVSTDDGTFVAGLGSIVAYNTDFMTRLHTSGASCITLMLPVVHMWHEPPPAGGGEAAFNLGLMQESHRNGVFAPNGDNWGLAERKAHFGTEITHEQWIEIQRDELASWTDKAWPSKSGKLIRERKYLQKAFDDLHLGDLVPNDEDGVAIDFGCGPLSILELLNNNLQKIAVDPLHDGYETIRDWEHDKVMYTAGRGEDRKFSSNLPVRIITSINGIDHYESPYQTLVNMTKTVARQGFIALHYCINNASEGHPHPAHRIDLDLATMIAWGEGLGLEIVQAEETTYGWRHQRAAAIVFRKP
jgi:intein/homing endonuclease